MLEHFFESVDGWFNFREIYESVMLELPDRATVVELGSWYGRSAAFLAVEIARSTKAITFYCVDTWKGSVDSPWMAEKLGGGSALPIFLDNMRRGGVEHVVRPLAMPSLEAAAEFAAESIDFVMIDASHDYYSVRNDVRAWYPKVKQGGIIAGDDADWPGVLIGVHETIADSDIRMVNGRANWWHRKERPNRGTWQIQRVQQPAELLTYIPYVNRPDLLVRAVGSIPSLWRTLVIIDQSVSGIAPAIWKEIPALEDQLAGLFRVPTGSMSFSQMMNWARQEAIDRKVRHLVFMHNDAEVIDPTLVGRLLEVVRRRERSGVVFTNYDALCAFSVRALEEAGPWDETFQWYFADNDYYRRLQLGGWPPYDIGGDGLLHYVSQTLNSDPVIRRQVDDGWRWHINHYIHKWGGPPGAELHRVPYNGHAW